MFGSFVVTIKDADNKLSRLIGCSQVLVMALTSVCQPGIFLSLPLFWFPRLASGGHI